MGKPLATKKWIVINALVSAFSLAEVYQRPLPEPTPVPAIEVEEPTRYRSNRAQISTEFSMLSPTVLEDRATRTEKTLGGIPTVTVGAVLPLFRQGQFQFHGAATIGFGTNTGTFQVSQGDNRYSETSRVLWIPAGLSFESDYEFAGLPFIKPALSFGVGGQYFSQKVAGGSSSDILTPYFNIHPHLIFLQNSDPNGWFGGFTFGMTRWWGVGPSRISASSVDMAFLFNL